MAILLGFFLIVSLATIPEFGEGKHLHAYVFANTMNWFEAYDFCRGKLQNLVSIMNNQDHWHQQETVIRCGELCLGPGRHLTQSWTAGSDLKKNREFVWVTSMQPITQDRWARDRPPDNRGGDESCVEMVDFPNEKRAILNDVPCRANTMYVICESKDAFGT